MADSTLIMLALPVAEDWLHGELSADIIAKMHEFNAALYRQHEHTIDTIRKDTYRLGVSLFLLDLVN